MRRVTGLLCLVACVVTSMAAAFGQLPPDQSPRDRAPEGSAAPPISAAPAQRGIYRPHKHPRPKAHTGVYRASVHGHARPIQPLYRTPTSPTQPPP
ncbi:MAG: hypothetical protein JO212_01690 [Acetobacteraceae bacterium]|nr:hypothetical protein [Acetobacteraceae bacterium]MBV8588775.1 hypothetical protein [Acetobacteraceae bacterium]